MNKSYLFDFPCLNSVNISIRIHDVQMNSPYQGLLNIPSLPCFVQMFHLKQKKNSHIYFDLTCMRFADLQIFTLLQRFVRLDQWRQVIADQELSQLGSLLTFFQAWY